MLVIFSDQHVRQTFLETERKTRQLPTKDRRGHSEPILNTGVIFKQSLLSKAAQ